jgi:hypothetical protein
MQWARMYAAALLWGRLIVLQMYLSFVITIQKGDQDSSSGSKVMKGQAAVCSCSVTVWVSLLDNTNDLVHGLACVCLHKAKRPILISDKTTSPCMLLSVLRQCSKGCPNSLMMSRTLLKGHGFCICFPTGWMARIGSGLFLVIQMVILLDFTQSWNDAWVANGEEDERWLYALLAITVTAFGGVLAIAGMRASWFVTWC